MTEAQSRVDVVNGDDSLVGILINSNVNLVREASVLPQNREPPSVRRRPSTRCRRHHYTAD